MHKLTFPHSSLRPYVVVYIYFLRWKNAVLQMLEKLLSNERLVSKSHQVFYISYMHSDNFVNWKVVSGRGKIYS